MQISHFAQLEMTVQIHHASIIIFDETSIHFFNALASTLTRNSGVFFPPNPEEPAAECQQLSTACHFVHQLRGTFSEEKTLVNEHSYGKYDPVEMEEI